MSSRPRCADPEAGGARRAREPREPREQEQQRRREQKRRRHDAQQLQQLKHLESFYEKPPPGLIKEDETKPEDCIPDVPGNEHAREFLAHAPTKGLWMPLGKEVKVMQCWRCKRYGHRTGDKECPFFIKGNQKLEQFRVAHEDPMYDIIRENKRHEKDMRIQQLKQLLEDSTSSDEESSSGSSECQERHKKRKKKEKHKRKKKEKKKKKKRKHKSPKSNGSSARWRPSRKSNTGQRTGCGVGEEGAAGGLCHRPDSSPASPGRRDRERDRLPGASCGRR